MQYLSRRIFSIHRRETMTRAGSVGILSNRTGMQLKFPHARLLVYNCLVRDGVGCVQAIVKTSKELGLIATARLTTLKLPIETSDCGSLFAAKHVLEQSLIERGYCLTNGDKALADRLWANIELDVNDYKTQTSLVHIRVPGTVSSTIECSHMAPIVMDVLLQQLTPYI